MRCLVIDDEPLALQQLVSYVSKIPYLELVKACSGPTEAMQAMASEKVDAIFTDIEMPDINGLEYIRSLKNKPIIVFVTAYADFAVEGFQVDATDYLLK
ncbi:MAG TPA: DNA-binding response regulator, partial [Rikenellaceae bacterium]|nr:DNA-binding response regulator [Rikenellaceae bacterium]